MTDRRTFLAGLAAVFAAGPVLGRGLARYPKPDRELMVPVEGGRIYVRVNGDLSAPRPPVVFIHGGPGGSHEGFLDALPLADERAVILYDQLDSGKSEHPMNPTHWKVSRFVDEVDAVRRALSVPRWHVCGHSWGGTVALEYGGRRPKELVSLVLASPLVSTRTWIADASILRQQLPPAVQAELTTCDRRSDDAGCDAATAAYYARFLSREPPSKAREAYLASIPTPEPVNRLYETMWGRSEFVCTGTLRTYDGEPLLRKLDGIRTLFVGGQYDEARPSTLLTFAGTVPGGAELATIPGAGHAIFSDRPDEILGILRPWLTRQDRAWRRAIVPGPGAAALR
jgi:proline iminopeptidase/L-proline amide hydrolase